MTRMTREFSLVLLGASALTAAYFLWPEQDFEKRSEEQAPHERPGECHQASATAVDDETPDRCRASAATTSGSNCDPAFRRSSASAASALCAFL